MMRLSPGAASVVCVATALVSAGGASAQVPSEVRSRIVQIEGTPADEQRQTQCGVGFLVTPRVVMTALHVLAPERSGFPAVRRFTLTSEDGRSISVELSDLGDALGVGPRLVLPARSTKAERSDVAFLVLGSDFPGVSSSRGTVAFARRASLPDRGGILASYHRAPCAGTTELTPAGFTSPGTRLEPPRIIKYMNGDTERMRLDVKESPGYSGSPVFSRTFGRVVGVYTAADRGQGGYGYATALDSREVRALYLEAVGEDVPPVDVDEERWRQQSYGAMIFAGGLGGFSPYPSGTVAAQYSLEFGVFPEYSHFGSFAGFVRAGVSLGKYKSSFLDPAGARTLEPGSAKWFWSARGELGMELRLFRMDQFGLAFGAGATLSYLGYDRPVGIEDDHAGVGGVARVRGHTQISKSRMFIEATGMVVNLPSVQYRYLGIGGQIREMDRRGELSGELGLGYEY